MNGYLVNYVYQITSLIYCRMFLSPKMDKAVKTFRQPLSFLDVGLTAEFTYYRRIAALSTYMSTSSLSQLELHERSAKHEIRCLTG